MKSTSSKSKIANANLPKPAKPTKVMEKQIDLLIAKTLVMTPEFTIEYNDCLLLAKEIEEQLISDHIESSLKETDKKLAKVNSLFNKTEKLIAQTEKKLASLCREMESYQNTLTDMPPSEERDALLVKLETQVNQVFINAKDRYAEIACFKKTISDLSTRIEQKKSEQKMKKEQEKLQKEEAKLNALAESLPGKIEKLGGAATQLAGKLLNVTLELETCHENGISVPELVNSEHGIQNLVSSLQACQEQLTKLIHQINPEQGLSEFGKSMIFSRDLEDLEIDPEHDLNWDARRIVKAVSEGNLQSKLSK